MAEDFEMSAKPTSSTAEIAAAESHVALKLLAAIADTKLDLTTRARHLSELAETLKRIAAAADRLVDGDSLPAERGKDEHSDCWYCGQPQQPTEKDLEKHIGEAVRTASWAGWSETAFVAKMRATLEPGDRILYVGAGFVNVKRRDGRLEAIYKING